MLRTDEYIQMAGRAGRRGKDTRGFVYYLPDRKPETVEDVQRMMTGRQQSLDSRMDFHYDFLLKCLQSGTTGWLGLVKQSYWYVQRQMETEGRQAELVELQKKYAVGCILLPPPVQNVFDLVGIKNILVCRLTVLIGHFAVDVQYAPDNSWYVLKSLPQTDPYSLTNCPILAYPLGRSIEVRVHVRSVVMNRPPDVDEVVVS